MENLNKNNLNQKQHNILQQIKQQEIDIMNNLNKEVESNQLLKRAFNPHTDITKKIAAMELILNLLFERKMVLIYIIGFFVCYGVGRLGNNYASVVLCLFVGIGIFSLFKKNQNISMYKSKYGIH